MTPAARSATSLVKTPQSISPCRGGLIKLIRTRVQGWARPGGAIQLNGAESAQSTQAPSCQCWGHFSHPSPPASCTCFALTRGGACIFAQAHTHGTVSPRARLARARLRGWARQPPAFPYITEMLQAAENSKCCFNYVLYGRHPASWKRKLTTGLPGYLQWQKPRIHPNVSLKGKMSGLSVK